jgi:phosphate transport system protein
VRLVRTAVHTELDELIDDLASMGRLVTQIMINASAALLQADLALAELVIARGGEMDAQHYEVQQRCITLLALHAPVATDLRAVVATMHSVDDLQRMGSLAQHIVTITRLTYPNMALPDGVRPVIARMSLLACGLAQQAATAIRKLDPLSGDRLARASDEIDALLRQLLRTLFAENWSQGKEPAVHAALVGRYYEHFAHHAVAVASQVGSLFTGRMRSRFPSLGPPARGTDSNPMPLVR